MSASEKEPHPKRFVVDSMLGKVAKWLRILGFDTRYERLRDPTQVEAYARDGFHILSRNLKWCGWPSVTCVAANSSLEQFREVVERVPILPHEVALFQRCVQCNEPLQPLPRELALGAVPDFVFETHTLFSRCPTCNRTYWPGSHTDHMVLRLRELLGWSEEVFGEKGG